MEVVQRKGQRGPEDKKGRPERSVDVKESRKFIRDHCVFEESFGRVERDSGAPLGRDVSRNLEKPRPCRKGTDDPKK